MKYLTLIAVSITALSLSACSGTKETLGLTKTPPDEFKVVKRAPLEMPPSYTLRPPSPGAPRPQEQEMVEEARQTVLGQSAGQQYAPTSAENALLMQAGASQADPGIRQKVDTETVELKDKNKPVIDKLLNLAGSETEASASVVDAKAEAERLKSNAQEGKPVTDGETPTIEE